MLSRFAKIVALAVLSFVATVSNADETLTRGTNLTVDISSEEVLAMALAGDIWTVPLAGGDATPLSLDIPSVQQPRWSPDGSKIAFTATAEDKHGIWVHDLAADTTQALSEGMNFDMHPAWHPAGDRIIFEADRKSSGYDLWEVDVATGLRWRVSRQSGDETEAAWSRDGRDLIYVHHEADVWSIVLRRHGEAEEVLVSGPDRLAGPSWRPDGSLITYWRDNADGVSLDIVILSQPRMLRRYGQSEDFSTAPVSWLDRQRLFYSAGGLIRQRLFNSWTAKTVAFRATILASPPTVIEPIRRSLPSINEPPGAIVVRAARLFDGLGSDYRRNVDILIEGGRVRSIEAQADRPGIIVIDMGDLAVLPGLIDVHARLPASTDETAGPYLLAAGVTTLVSDFAAAEHLNTVFAGKEMPGPRLLPASDWPVSPFSGLADSQTPDLESLFDSRAAQLIDFDDVIARRYGQPPTIEHGKTSMVLGSSPNGLPAGIGVHAELRALVAAGLQPAQALRAAGVNAAAALGVDPNLGRVATGAAADLIFVDGDPLTNINDTVRVVAVVRNGRFFSVAGLIDRVEVAKTVE